MAALKKEALVKAIAQDLLLREDVVEEVLDRFIDIAVEEIANKGELKIHRFLSVSTVAYKSYQAGKGTVPAHDRLKVRLSEGLHRLFKHRNAADVVVTRDNWRELLQELNRGAHGKSGSFKAEVEQEFFNPLLDDD